jgi:hypothetical protein
VYQHVEALSLIRLRRLCCWRLFRSLLLKYRGHVPEQLSLAHLSLKVIGHSRLKHGLDLQIHVAYDFPSVSLRLFNLADEGLHRV